MGGLLPTYTEKISSNDQLRHGDQIAVDRIVNGYTIQHHGIVVPGNNRNNMKVISFSSPIKKNSDKNEIIIEDLSRFVLGKMITRITYNPGVAYSNDEVVNRAILFLQGNMSYEEYHYLSNNCEHFATYVKTGVKQSTQSDGCSII